MKNLFHEDNYDRRLRPFYKGKGLAGSVLGYNIFVFD